MLKQTIPTSHPELRWVNPTEIGEILATIAHDMRNPLTTVLLGLAHCHSLPLSDHDRLRMELALSEAQRLQQMIDNLLDFAYLPRLEHTKIEVNAFVDEILILFTSIPKNAVRTIEFVRSDRPLWLLGDRCKLTQVFINLLDNACEATPDGSLISWTINPDPDNLSITIEIHNWGDPIPPQFLSYVTQPFCTTKSTGHGLGLTIVRQIVEAHQGCLKIISTAATGTTVRLELPMLLRG